MVVVGVGGGRFWGRHFCGQGRFWLGLRLERLWWSFFFFPFLSLWLGLRSVWVHELRLGWFGCGG